MEQITGFTRMRRDVSVVEGVSLGEQHDGADYWLHADAQGRVSGGGVPWRTARWSSSVLPRGCAGTCQWWRGCPLENSTMEQITGFTRMRRDVSVVEGSLGEQHDGAAPCFRADAQGRVSGGGGVPWRTARWSRLLASRGCAGTCQWWRGPLENSTMEQLRASARMRRDVSVVEGVSLGEQHDGADHWLHADAQGRVSGGGVPWRTARWSSSVLPRGCAGTCQWWRGCPLENSTMEQITGFTRMRRDVSVVEGSLGEQHDGAAPCFRADAQGRVSGGGGVPWRTARWSRSLASRGCAG